MVEAAAIPETFFTVLAEHVHARQREAAATGCWCTAARRASAPPRSCSPRRSARSVITTAGSAEKCEAASKLGADVAVNYKTEDFVAATKKATGGNGADLIVDIVGGDYIDRNYDAAAEQGVIAQMSFTGRPEGHGRTSPG